MRLKTTLTAAVLAVFVIGAVWILLAGRGGSASPVPATASSAPAAASTTASYTLAQVAQHSDAASCWTAINGSVYDVTSWVGQHPGGPEHILSICGKDGSSAFNDQHAGQGAPAAELATFKIGTLSQ